MTENTALGLDAIRAETVDLIGSLWDTVAEIATHDHPRVAIDNYCDNRAAWMGERMATVLRRLNAEIAEVERLREQLAIAEQLADAVQAWAEDIEEDPNRPTTLLHGRDGRLYNAAEEYRLMDMALTSARETAEGGDPR